MFLGNDPITDENMIASLDALTEGKDTTVFFRADKTVDYETMMKVMDTLHQAGYLKVVWWAKKPSKRSNPPFHASPQAGLAPAFLIVEAKTCKTNRVDV